MLSMFFKPRIPVGLILIIAWLARLSASSNQDNEEEVSFDGSSFITYKLSATKITRQDHILILFRTIKPSGLLLHSGGKNGDFMTLELVGGKLRYSANLGSFGNVSGFNEFYIGNHLADNEWHQVDITRQGKNLLINLDVTKLPLEVRGKYATLELDDRIYVAGIDQKGESLAKTLHQRKLPFTKFEGCFDDIILNRQNFATLAKKRDPNITMVGNVSFGCHMTKYLPVRFLRPHSHIVISMVPYSDVLSFSFKFRSYDSDGLLVMHKDKKQQGANVSLWLINGRLKLEVAFHASSKHVTLHTEKSLIDGQWHSVAVHISGRKIQLQVDGISLEHKLSPVHRFTNSLQIVIGSDGTDNVGFVGCIYDIVVQDREVNVSRERSSSVLIGNCSLDDHCLPNPCQNWGKCVQRLSEAKCDCSQTRFGGKHCEIPAVSGRETCADWKTSGETRDGLYMISPKNIGPFPVYCKLRNLKEPITVINHVLAGKPVKAVNPRTRKAGFYFHPVKYSVDLTNIRALISASTHCRQHLTYNCLNSLLFDSSHEFDLDQGRGARWISRDGKTMDYWAGATPGSHKCACGISNTCFRQDLKCNCDAWDSVRRKDEGYITDMEALPVKNVKFSVRATSLESDFTLGELECFGRKVVQTTRTPTKMHSLSLSSSMLTSSSSSNGKSTNKANINTLPNITPTTITKTKNMTDPYHSSTYGPPIDNPPSIVIIESTRKYFTIRQNSNQELILIILSVILAVFILAILILMIRQNLFLPCKCVDGPVYRDVSNVDSIELGPPSSLFTNVDTEIVEYEASPYPSRSMEGVVINSSGRDSSCRVIHVNVLESDSNESSDRLHLSGGTSPLDSDDKEDWNKNKFGNSEYEDLGSLEMVLLKTPQEMVEVQVEKMKEALYEVISASEVHVNNNPVTKEVKRENAPCSLIQEEERSQLSTINCCGMEFSAPPSYQDIEETCSSEQELGSDSTHAQSTRSSTSCSLDDENNPEHDQNTTDYETNEQSSPSKDFPITNDFRVCNSECSTSDVVSNKMDKNSQNIDHSSSHSNGPANIDTNTVPFDEESKSHSYEVCKDRAESEPLLLENLPSSPSLLNGILDLNEIADSDYSSANNDSDVIDDLLAHARPDGAEKFNVDSKNGDLSEPFRHETSL